MPVGTLSGCSFHFNVLNMNTNYLGQISRKITKTTTARSNSAKFRKNIGFGLGGSMDASYGEQGAVQYIKDSITYGGELLFRFILFAFVNPLFHFIFAFFYLPWLFW
jgi:hypothetical protein